MTTLFEMKLFHFWHFLLEENETTFLRIRSVFYLNIKANKKIRVTFAFVESGKKKIIIG